MAFVDQETSSRIVMDDGRVLTRCDQCKQMYSERKPPGTPPCESCLVELKVENEDAAMVYMSCRRQYVTAEQGRIVDISIPAIKVVMDLNGVQDQNSCLKKVRSLFYHMENERRKDEGG